MPERYRLIRGTARRALLRRFPTPCSSLRPRTSSASSPACTRAATRGDGRSAAKLTANKCIDLARSRLCGEVRSVSALAAHAPGVSANPGQTKGGAWLEPERERWNHNNHYHDLLLRHLDTSCRRVLDVGCGHGFFAAELARVADRVDAVDLDPAVIAEAAPLHSCPRIEFMQGDFLSLELPELQYDAVTSIAALHHMDFLRAALRKSQRLPLAGGRLVARRPLPRGVSDRLRGLRLSAVAADRLHRAGRSHRGGRGMTAPTCAPSLSLREVRSAAAEVLPGASISRRLYWRFLLVWEKPRPLLAESR